MFKRFSVFVTGLVLLLLALPAAAGTVVEGQNLLVKGRVTVTKPLVLATQSTTCASNGAGTAAACSLQVNASTVLYTCSDSDTCAITLAEAGGDVVAGEMVTIINMGANAITFADSAGVQELPASVSLAITETISFRYSGTAWVQAGPGTTVNTATAFTVSGGTVTGANSETLNIGSTDATFKLSRNDTGIVTLTAADNDATAALTVLPGGAAAMVLGGASTTSLTVTTDSTGTAEVALPAGSIDTTEMLDATLLPADEAYPGRGSFTICGDAVTIATATPIYYGPSSVVLAGYGRTCDITQAGNATEATADAPAFQAKAFQVRGMVCLLNDPGATGTPIAFTLRSATADLTPSVTCSIADNETGCVASQQTTTAIASGATVAVKAVGSGDVGTAQFHCTVYVAF